ncbi:MAG TPA: hypothetical protein VK766_11615, partial [Cytophagaceae bacterium]|nr:hypothetical protein [Cytophagaceae bacterium]
MHKILNFLRIFSRLFDILLSPLTLLGSVWFRIVKFWGLNKLPFTEKILLKVGVHPVVDHYFEPYIDYTRFKIPLDKERSLKAIDLNIKTQINLLTSFHYQNELLEIEKNKRGTTPPVYYYNNGAFNSGDSDYLYSLIRWLAPRRIIEIGSGNSTLMMIEA